MITFLKKIHTRKNWLVVALALVPGLAFGAFSGTYFTDMVTTAKTVVAGLIPVMIGLTFIFFAWNMIQYIRSESSDKEKYKSSLIWSVIAIVLVVSIWGIVNLLQSIFGATDYTIKFPNIPGASGSGASGGVSPEVQEQINALPGM